MALITVTEFRTFTGSSFSNISDAQLTALIDATSVVIENYIGYPLLSATHVDYYSGNNTKFIVLRVKPVTSITSVYHDPNAYFETRSGSFDSTTLLTSGVDYALQEKDSTTSKSALLVRIKGVWPEYPRYREAFKLSKDFVPSHGDIKVTYVAGYATIPSDIKLAVVQIVVRLLTSLRFTGPLKAEKLGDHSYELFAVTKAMNELASVRQILSKYKDVPW